MTIALRSTYSAISDFFFFAACYLKSPREVGTPFACSAAVGRQILAFFPPPSKEPRKFLEIGPGAKSFVAIELDPKDHLDLVEIGETFCNALRELYKNRPNIEVHCMPVQDWKPSYQYDAIASFVPLSALPSKAYLQPVLDSYVRLAKPGTNVVSVGYLGITTLKGWTLFGQAKKEFQAVIATKDAFFAKYGTVVAKVWRNFPPAWVACSKMA